MPYILRGGDDPAEGDHDVTITACGVRHEIDVTVNRLTQKPALGQATAAQPTTGTSIRLAWPNNTCFPEDDEDSDDPARVAACSNSIKYPHLSSSLLLHGARWRFAELAQDYAAMNPHMNIQVTWLGGHLEHWRPATPKWKKWCSNNGTGAHWYTAERFRSLVAGLIAHDRTLEADRTLSEFIGDFDGLHHRRSHKEILESLGVESRRLSGLAKGDDLDNAKVDRLLNLMQESVAR